MRIKSVKVQPDSSAWSAVVCYGGPKDVELVISCLYTAGRLTVAAAGYDHVVPMYSLGAERAAFEWAEWELAKLPPEWHAAHAQMYGIAEVA